MYAALFSFNVFSCCVDTVIQEINQCPRNTKLDEYGLHCSNHSESRVEVFLHLTWKNRRIIAIRWCEFLFAKTWHSVFYKESSCWFQPI